MVLLCVQILLLDLELLDLRVGAILTRNNLPLSSDEIMSFIFAILVNLSLSQRFLSLKLLPAIFEVKYESFAHGLALNFLHLNMLRYYLLVRLQTLILRLG